MNVCLNLPIAAATLPPETLQAPEPAEVPVPGSALSALNSFVQMTYGSRENLHMLYLIICVLVITCIYLSKERSHWLHRENKERVVIIGSSSGIGKELSLQYAKRGAKLILMSRRENLLKELTKKCLETSSSVNYFKGDITNEADLKGLLDLANEKLGGVDTLILCAGILSSSQFKEETETSLIQTIFNTNTIGPILAARIFLKALLVSKGNLVVISSVAGLIPAPTRSIYGASKAAINLFFNSLRIEYESRGLNICLILPATVKTEFRNSALDAEDNLENNKTFGIDTVKCCNIIIRSSDLRLKQVFIPVHYFAISLLEKIFPSVTNYFAKKKYGFH
ncbi:hypothetical protein HK099_004139 [Clydaea vesicula]|uniref:Uncharacterized protein n=1 Tax=Clydaea vesicula TaxID=447962 RepID=A0AAD5U287_9FUNG|nr:hypothetical protein HK099_004139 [Clydaea vesicula]